MSIRIEPMDPPPARSPWDHESWKDDKCFLCDYGSWGDKKDKINNDGRKWFKMTIPLYCSPNVGLDRRVCEICIKNLCNLHKNALKVLVQSGVNIK